MRRTPKPVPPTPPGGQASGGSPKRHRRTVTVCFAVVLLICCLGLTVYPLISAAYYAAYNERVTQSYEQQVEQVDTEEINRELALAVAYNQAMAKGDLLPCTYDQVLDPGKNGIMGYVEIPKLSAKLPIAHGTDSATLERAVGHLSGTALPVGGDGTHCILTGHSGMASQRLFSDLDTLQVGDIFYLEVLGQRLAYRVDQILTVLPWQDEALQPIPGMDCCTLVTCTPFGINTHRLLVRGSRVTVPEATDGQPDPTGEAQPLAPDPRGTSPWLRQYLLGIGLGLAASALLILAALFLKNRRKRKNAEQSHPHGSIDP